MLITQIHIVSFINVLIQVLCDLLSVDEHLVSFSDLSIYGPEAIIDFSFYIDYIQLPRKIP